MSSSALAGSASLRILDYAFLTRPVLLGPVWTLLLAGFVRAGQSEWSPRSLATFLLFSILLGGVYALNQACDVESDRQNRKLFLVPEGHIAAREARWFGSGLIAVALLLAPFLGAAIAALMLSAAILGLAYSCPPFRWKCKLVPGFAANAVGYGVITFAIGWMAGGGGATPKIAWAAIPYVFAVAAVYINTTIPDIEGDRKTGALTPAVRFGPRQAATASTVCLLLSIVSGASLGDMVIVATGLGAIPLFALLYLRPCTMTAVRASKAAIGLLSVLLAVYHPVYVAVMAVTFAASRLYYSKRFGITYPVLWDR